MIKLTSTDQIIGVHDKQKMNFDRYDIEVGTPFSTKEYSIVVDFINEEITGDCIAYGSWFDIEEADCLELIEIILKDNKPIRDFSHITKKLKLKGVVKNG
uniref:hypothetical protein n=1 Tax=Carnobacterium sp. TaxID=48221 RepID=UPI00344C3131